MPAARGGREADQNSQDDSLHLVSSLAARSESRRPRPGTKRSGIESSPRSYCRPLSLRTLVRAKASSWCGDFLRAACRRTLASHPEERDANGFGNALLEGIEKAASLALDVRGMVGTGYGRQLLPFPEEDIRSEILCHGLGAHALFPGTRTILDIGGQDTKAIQVDPIPLQRA